ncbi:hypothetical protein [Nocardia asiatica]|uniref:hypothetical protein n=1 Tax=Nocardia asiatica TaxID=209252 RepID=UPI002457FD17|nr:hypothetical protein [Nocardia asiatica]
MTTEEWADAIADALNTKFLHLESLMGKACGADECDRWQFEWACDKVKGQRDSLIAKARAFGDPAAMERALDRHMLGYVLAA